MALYFSNVRIRFFHCGNQLKSVDKALLSKLRKKTGFPFNNCKKALEIKNNDFVQAEAWLREQAQKEGWAKATKLATRPMSQGLIGIHMGNHCASMVEVNCETDFVARNVNFQGLVSKVASLCLEAGVKSSENKILWDREGLSQLPADSGKKISDLIALNIGTIGENMAVRRGVFFRVPSSALVGCYAHGSENNSKSITGKYGALVSWTIKSLPRSGDFNVHTIGRQLAQHVVGMNPITVGGTEKDKQENVSEDKQVLEQVASCSGDSGGAEIREHEKRSAVGKVENRMIFQEFLLDPEILVGEFLQRHSAQVLDFVRYECGEELLEVGTSV